MRVLFRRRELVRGVCVRRVTRSGFLAHSALKGFKDAYDANMKTAVRLCCLHSLTTQNKKQKAAAKVRVLWPAWSVPAC